MNRETSPKKITNIHIQFLCLSLIPMLFMGIIITVFSAERFAASLNKEVQNGLMSVGDSLLTYMESEHEGDYRMEEIAGALYFYKGDYLFNGNFELIDSIKEKTGLDISLFYEDIRVITTLRDRDGIRLVGTKANPVVKKDVLSGKKSSFYPSVNVDGKFYFAVYLPLINSDGSCVGMLFLGKPVQDVKMLLEKSIKPIIVIALICMLLEGIIVVYFSGRFVKDIETISAFMKAIAKGKLHEELEYRVRKRDDELGNMGRSAIDMQKALRALVEEDRLTGLFNRRSGETLIKKSFDEVNKYGISCCIAIGDIDFFKKVNDTYGHEAGDTVLVVVADKLKTFMKGKGYVIRWGGEEFLIVFDNIQLERAEQLLNELREEVAANVVAYEDKEIPITMTMGVIQVDDTFANVDKAINAADELLYFGKENGRNRVVSKI